MLARKDARAVIYKKTSSLLKEVRSTEYRIQTHRRLVVELEIINASCYAYLPVCIAQSVGIESKEIVCLNIAQLLFVCSLPLAKAAAGSFASGIASRNLYFLDLSVTLKRAETSNGTTLAVCTSSHGKEGRTKCNKKS